MAWLASTWSATWPNLLANVLWIPVVWVHHKAMARHVRALRQHVTALHDQHEQLIVQHVLKTGDGAKQDGVTP